MICHKGNPVRYGAQSQNCTWRDQFVLILLLALAREYDSTSADSYTINYTEARKDQWLQTFVTLRW